MLYNIWVLVGYPPPNILYVISYVYITITITWINFRVDKISRFREFLGFFAKIKNTEKY